MESPEGGRSRRKDAKNLEIPTFSSDRYTRKAAHIEERQQGCGIISKLCLVSQPATDKNSGSSRA